MHLFLFKIHFQYFMSSAINVSFMLISLMIIAISIWAFHFFYFTMQEGKLPLTFLILSRNKDACYLLTCSLAWFNSCRSYSLLRLWHFILLIFANKLKGFNINFKGLFVIWRIFTEFKCKFNCKEIISLCVEETILVTRLDNHLWGHCPYL